MNNLEIINGFYLNLDSRTDRKLEMESQLVKTKHNIIRYSAFDGKLLDKSNEFKETINNFGKYQYATYLSHLGMLKTARDNKWDKVIILEDDIQICDEFDDRLNLALEMLPNDFDIFYLGVNEQKNTKFTRQNDWLWLVKETYGCFGMIINGNKLNSIIEIIESEKIAVDHIIKNKIQPKNNCYVFLPFMVYVKDNFSDIWGKYRTLPHIKKYYSDSITLPEESRYKIPKIIHQIWVGDQTKRPTKFINKCKELHPNWEHMLWTEKELNTLTNLRQFNQHGNQSYNGMANVARYEILYNYGGVYLDADTEILRPIDDLLDKGEFFAAYENEIVRNGLIANGTIGSVKNHIILEELIHTIRKIHDVNQDSAWKITGVKLFTDIVSNNINNLVNIFPSYYFYPEHFTGQKYLGDFKSYATQHWYSTNQKKKEHKVKNKNINSIIIPTYKNTSFIDECINSVINSCQGLDVEILIGIDSCNETLDYIKNKSFDNRVKFLFFKDKVGAYIIRNSLAKIANSDILLFFDSDDIMETNMVTNIIDKIKTSDVVRPMYVDFSNTPNYNIKQGDKFGEGVFAIKKDLFLSMNGFEPWPVTADTDFMVRLNKNNKTTTYTNSVVFYRRIHPNSLTQAPETGMKSKLRSKYAHMTYSRKDFKPLPKLVTSDFYEVPITTYQYHNTNSLETPIDSQSKIDIKKLMNINVNKKEPVNIDYDKINSVLNKVPKFYQTINNTPPPRQNIPQNRNELIELKKDSLIQVNKNLFSKGKKFKG
jgi:mannosyltransferase OCH1-like enzyme